MMMTPTIHLNGTSAADLLDGYAEAAGCVRDAIDAMHRAATPNGRDYYPQGPGAIEQAMAEHRDRVQALGRVLTELVQLMEAVADADGGAE
jgi:hypothetical protein